MEIMADTNSKQDANKKFLEEKKYVAIGLVLGMSFGAAFGTVFDNVGIGVSMGMILGIIIGTQLDLRKRKRSQDKD